MEGGGRACGGVHIVRLGQERKHVGIQEDHDAVVHVAHFLVILAADFHRDLAGAAPVGEQGEGQIEVPGFLIADFVWQAVAEHGLGFLIQERFHHHGVRAAAVGADVGPVGHGQGYHGLTVIIPPRGLDAQVAHAGIQLNAVEGKVGLVHGEVFFRFLRAVCRREQQHTAVVFLPHRAVPADGNDTALRHCRKQQQIGVGSAVHVALEGGVRGYIIPVYLQINFLLALPALGDEQGDIKGFEGARHQHIGLH